MATKRPPAAWGGSETEEPPPPVCPPSTGETKATAGEARLERKIKRLEAFHPPPAGRSRPRGLSALCFRCTFRLAAPRAKKSTRGGAPLSRHQRAHFNSTRRQQRVGITSQRLDRALV